MDALLASFVAVALAEWGDKTQLLVLALVMRDGRVGPTLAGVTVGALANALLAAGAGIVLGDFITPRAIALLLVVALLFVGVGALIRPDEPELEPSRSASPFLIAAAGVFLAELGDKSQFLTAALAAQFNSFPMIAVGAAAGAVAVAIPAALLGDRFVTLVPVKAIRAVTACVFLLAGAVVAVRSLGLI